MRLYSSGASVAAIVALMAIVALTATGGELWAADAPAKKAAIPAGQQTGDREQAGDREKVADREQARESANAGDHEKAERERLEKEFASTMTGATLVGRFTMGSLADAPCKDDKPAAKSEPAKGGEAGKPAGWATPPLKEDRYVLGEVRKLEGDNWLIEARIQYGGHDVTVPLMLKVRWAGDTPVITLTDFSIPGLGVFTSRVLFYRGQYAGTWRHGDHGGEMFGRVIPKAKAE